MQNFCLFFAGLLLTRRRIFIFFEFFFFSLFLLLLTFFLFLFVAGFFFAFVVGMEVDEPQTAETSGAKIATRYLNPHLVFIFMALLF